MIRERKTAILLAGAAALAMLLLSTVFLGGGATFEQSTRAARDSVTAIGSEKSVGEPGREKGAGAETMPDAAGACTRTAVNAVRAWAAQTGDVSEWFTADATLPDPADGKPDMSAKEYKAGLASEDADTATCTVYTGGDRPWTVQLARIDGAWKATWLGMPGISSDKYDPSTEGEADAQ